MTTETSLAIAAGAAGCVQNVPGEGSHRDQQHQKEEDQLPERSQPRASPPRRLGNLLFRYRRLDDGGHRVRSFAGLPASR